MAGENLFDWPRQGIKSEFAFHLLKEGGGEAQQLSKICLRGVRMLTCLCSFVTDPVETSSCAF